MGTTETRGTAIISSHALLVTLCTTDLAILCLWFTTPTLIDVNMNRYFHARTSQVGQKGYWLLLRLQLLMVNECLE